MNISKVGKCRDLADQTKKNKIMLIKQTKQTTGSSRSYKQNRSDIAKIFLIECKQAKNNNLLGYF